MNCSGIVEVEVPGLDLFATPSNLDWPIAKDNSGHVFVTSQPEMSRIFYDSISDFLLVNFTAEDRTGWKDTCTYKVVRKGKFRAVYVLNYCHLLVSPLDIRKPKVFCQESVFIDYIKTANGKNSKVKSNFPIINYTDENPVKTIGYIPPNQSLVSLMKPIAVTFFAQDIAGNNATCSFNYMAQRNFLLKFFSLSLIKFIFALKLTIVRHGLCLHGLKIHRLLNVHQQHQRPHSVEIKQQYAKLILTVVQMVFGFHLEVLLNLHAPTAVFGAH